MCAVYLSAVVQAMSEIAAMPGVDLVFEKGENMGHMAERIRAVLHEKEEQQRLFRRHRSFVIVLVRVYV